MGFAKSNIRFSVVTHSEPSWLIVNTDSSLTLRMTQRVVVMLMNEVKDLGRNESLPGALTRCRPIG
jgi:hypothetical protein